MRSLLRKLKHVKRNRNTEASGSRQHTLTSSNEPSENSPRAENSSVAVNAPTATSPSINEASRGDKVVENGHQSPLEEEIPGPSTGGSHSNISQLFDDSSSHTPLCWEDAQNAECMWDVAYDDLKIEYEEIVRCYERIISGKMEMLVGNRDGTSPSRMSQTMINQSDTNIRRQQMRNFVKMDIDRLQDVGSTRTWQSSSLEEIMHSAWQISPQTTLAWAGLYCAREV